MIVRIPATSGNIGVGFDTAGLAFSLYNEIEFEELPTGLKIESGAEGVPLDETNLIYRAFCYACEKMEAKAPGLRLVQRDAIPMTRGLGSSAACIVGGIAIAQKLIRGEINREAMLNMATFLEGHPDNAAPAIYGGLTISVKEKDSVVSHAIPVPENLCAALIIPSYSLSTELARSILPKQLSMGDAVHNLSRLGLLISAFYQGDVSCLSVCLDDRLHIPYRKKLVKAYDEICAAAMLCGAYGACLSGAGPTIMALLDCCNTGFTEQLQPILDTLPGGNRVMTVTIDRTGLQLKE